MDIVRGAHVSTDDYGFTDHPDVVSALRATEDRLAARPCDVAMAAHLDPLPATIGHIGHAVRGVCAGGSRERAQTVGERAAPSAEPCRAMRGTRTRLDITNAQHEVGRIKAGSAG